MSTTGMSQSRFRDYAGGAQVCVKKGCKRRTRLIGLRVLYAWFRERDSEWRFRPRQPAGVMSPPLQNTVRFMSSRQAVTLLMFRLPAFPAARPGAASRARRMSPWQMPSPLISSRYAQVEHAALCRHANACQQQRASYAAVKAPAARHDANASRRGVARTPIYARGHWRFIDENDEAGSSHSPDKEF